ncbi:glycosyltransferase, partial [Fulvivirga sp. RKSG066]|uniref:glycosyltransferase n=1 Tax=Fulvivirga aurantia TaxID=2529383 RepID=UPI0012BCF538
EENNIPANAIVVGTVAVFRFQKRLKEWLQVFKNASDKDENLFAIIVGDGPLKQELVQERRELGLEGKVLMPGLQTNTVNWFSAMDVFMMTSIFEGLPIALLEAMSMQCAIVTTDAGGVKEVVGNNESGMMVSIDHWQDLSKELTKLVNSNDLISQLGNAARQRVRDSFSLQSMVHQLEKIYKRFH